MVQLHKASLVEPSSHSQKMLDLLDLKVSKDLIRYVAHASVDAITYAMECSSTASRNSSARKETIRFDPFHIFASNVVHRSEVKIPAILVSLVYIERARQHLFIQSPEWACERVFLGALILANKYINDWSIKNYHWALCSGVFGRRDIGRIEREFLDVLDWDLAVTEADILNHYDHISAFPSKPKPIPVPATPLTYVDMDAYPMETSDDSPLSSASPTPSPQTPTTVASPSNQPIHIHSLSNEELQTSGAVKQVPDPEPEEHKGSHGHSIFRLFHFNSNNQHIHPHQRV
ncbi:hypothetical protein BDM02DRAFT_3189546 [Thelephora ganbajun]|uniref:Uncharacterized protein n=1 Tax=Thelephora ganbajun TaxID=370292 RepID=A0ACB6Z7D9_THEGA|nr:hypothetical protein BDM02DRAFT_3189546 [Thelephora ganbajun]